MFVEKKTLGQRPAWTSPPISVPGAPALSGRTWSQDWGVKPGPEMAAPPCVAWALLWTCQPPRPSVVTAAAAAHGNAAAARKRTALKDPGSTGLGSETRPAHEPAHLPQVRATVHVQQVVAWIPVKAGVAPVLPKQSGLLRRRQPVAQTADDHQPVLGQ